MRHKLPDWVTDPQGMRTVIATLVTIFALVAPTTPADEVLAASLLGPTVLAYWLWALSFRFMRWPAAILGLTAPMVLNIAERDTQALMMVAVVTTAMVAAYSDRRRIVRAIVLSYMFVIFTLAIVGAMNDGFAGAMWVFALVVGWGLGEMLWRFSTTVDELARTRSLVVDQAMLQERRRIARDVHDLVGHSLSVVLLHISGARHLVHSDPDEAERALEQAEAAGRQSLADIRRTVSLLRDDADEGEASIPSPDLGDVKELVDDYVGAGLDVVLEQEGSLDLVDPTVALAAYRIAQEALTNASRHTVGAEVRVSIVVTDDGCDVAVTNRRGETIDLGRGSGFGLVSMRERAKSVGGSLVAGPTRDGWTVEASFPVERDRIRS